MTSTHFAKVAFGLVAFCGFALAPIGTAQAEKPTAGSKKPAPTAPAPAGCTVTITGIDGATPPTCTGAKNLTSMGGGKPTTKTTIELAGGATATFTFGGQPMNAMYTSSDNGFAYEVTLTVGTKKWSASRAPGAPAAPGATLRFTTSTFYGNTPEGQVSTSHGYTTATLTPVAGTGATGDVQFRVDF